MRSGSAPGMPWDQAEKIARLAKHDPSKPDSHIREMDHKLKHEELRDVISDEQKKLAETRRNV